MAACASIIGLCRDGVFSIFTLAATLCAQPRERNFSFEYRATVPATIAGKSFRLWVPVPHDDNYQRIINLKIDSSTAYKIATDTLGNQVVSVESNTLLGSR